MNLRKDQQGIAAVEAVIVLPTLLFMMVLIMDFGRVMYSGIANSSAVHVAASLGAQAVPLAMDSSGMEIAARRDASSDLPVNTSNSKSVNASARHFCRCPLSQAEVSCTADVCGGEVQELYVEVTSSRVFDTVSRYPGIPAALNLERKAVIRVQ
ncbi:MAG: TadE/TadG family type IV pilus assembly protein [Gammaproteobacteria bacterium]